MSWMDITIVCPEMPHNGPANEDKKAGHVYSGKFLPIERREKKGYNWTKIPPLYRFAKEFGSNGQFFAFPTDKIQVFRQSQYEEEMGIKFPASMENLKIIYYLCYRLFAMSEGRVSRRIRYDKLFCITDIKLPEDKYARKRKQDAICGKIDRILDYYKGISFQNMRDYRHVEDNDTLPGKKFSGVEILF